MQVMYLEFHADDMHAYYRYLFVVECHNYERLFTTNKYDKL